jgi:hypothetical protein
MFRSVVIQMTQYLAPLTAQATLLASTVVGKSRIRSSTRRLPPVLWLVVLIACPSSSFAAGVVYAVVAGAADFSIVGYNASTGAQVSQFGPYISGQGLAYGDGVLYSIGRSAPSLIYDIIGYDVTTGAQVSRFGDIHGGALAFAPVPIPPALWLFGSALGLMGVMRRKISS